MNQAATLQGVARALAESETHPHAWQDQVGDSVLPAISCLCVGEVNHLNRQSENGEQGNVV